MKEGSEEEEWDEWEVEEWGELVNTGARLKFASGLDHRTLQRLNASCANARGA